jgi:chemotaxis protein CheX
VDIPDDLVEAFTAAVPFALKEMADVEAVIRDSRVASAADSFADVAATIWLTTSRGVGRFTLGFPELTAAELARRILADAAIAMSPDLVRDCIGEVANVVAGQAKTQLVGSDSHFTLSTPMVQIGDQVQRTRSRWIIQFDSNIGEFIAHIFPPSDS